jgi:hypothetical protein
MYSDILNGRQEFSMSLSERRDDKWSGISAVWEEFCAMYRPENQADKC